MQKADVRIILARALYEVVTYTLFSWLLGALLLLAILSVSAAQQAAPKQDPEALARVFVEEMAAGKFEQAAARFDDTVGKLMPAPNLAETWKGVIVQAGAFQKITGTTRSDARAYRIVLVTCQFASGPWNVQVAFDAADHIAGLHFAPVRLPLRHGAPRPP